MNAAPVLAVTGASFGYERRAIVRDLDLVVDAGESVAILGPNGCGKSTFVKGVLGLNHRLGGDVTFFGVPTDQFKQRGRVGYVPQKHTLSASFPTTVAEVVALGRLALRPWYRGANAEDARAVARALELVAMDAHAKADVAELSGGQQRRVLIARALAAKPDLLIMDEPTAGVDAASQTALAEVLVRLLDYGVTLLTVTHEVDALRPALTRVAAMSDGTKVFDGSLAQWDAHVAAASLAHLDHHHDDEPEPSRSGLRDAFGHREERHG